MKDIRKIKEEIRDYFNEIQEEELLNLLSEKNEIPSGEYHKNYKISINGMQLLLRVNYGSQMHLPNQMEYEYSALENLIPSLRTPVPYYIDTSCSKYHRSYMAEEFLVGRPLDYRRDLEEAAKILKDIHSLKIPENSLLKHSGPAHEGIIEECTVMFEKYRNSKLAELKITRLIEEGFTRIKRDSEYYKERKFNDSIINTELNNYNFIIGRERGYLIDWEKPLIGDPLQDLAHFLAPTTTFWRTDVILSEEDKNIFKNTYFSEKEKSSVFSSYDSEYLNFLISCNCLRGITWCSMAYVQYNEDSEKIKNESAYKKIKEYMNPEFISKYLLNKF